MAVQLATERKVKQKVIAAGVGAGGGSALGGAIAILVVELAGLTLTDAGVAALTTVLNVVCGVIGAIIGGYMKKEGIAFLAVLFMLLLAACEQPFPSDPGSAVHDEKLRHGAGRWFDYVDAYGANKTEKQNDDCTSLPCIPDIQWR